MRLSICIPTYNRATHLTNCLKSIAASRLESTHEIQVCVSDNGSTDNTEQVVRAAQAYMPIVYHRNPTNLGIPQNFLNVVAMADGDFVWLLGDDDLVVPTAVDQLCALIGRHPGVDFFYVNSFHLHTEYVLSFPQPFSTNDLPAKMKPFSSWPNSGELRFFELVDPKRSFDFLGGMFLSVFKRQCWMDHRNALNNSAITDARTFSSFDNTFPHVKIFSRAFSQSQAYFCATPLSVCLTGAREWAPMYPMIRSVRLVEALDEYKKNGLSRLRYLWCKNFALHFFLPDLAYMYVHKDVSGYQYVDVPRLIRRNFLYPNVYLSVLYYVVRKIHQAVSNIVARPSLT